MDEADIHSGSNRRHKLTEKLRSTESSPAWDRSPRVMFASDNHALQFIVVAVFVVRSTVA